jgi:hypothetical protein
MQAQYIYVDLRINNHNKTVNHHILIIKNYELLVWSSFSSWKTNVYMCILQKINDQNEKKKKYRTKTKVLKFHKINDLNVTKKSKWSKCYKQIRYK